MVKRFAPLVACAGVVVALAALVPDQVDPVNTTISAALAHGGSTRLALAALGLAALALWAGMRAGKAPVGGWPERLILAWATAMAAAPFLPEMVWQVLAFTTLPAATAQLVGRFADDERWRVVARPVEWLTLAAGLGVAALTYVALPGDGVMMGLVERALLGVEVAVLAVLAARLVHLSWAHILPKLPSPAFHNMSRNMSLTRSK
ncbi:hypothetical protein Aph01nite_57850 [Acrocarpospora phusangensis]|uniref:Uncharacterized protein n=1 Tax=Acrocarpospora phusangensis TaxID=1070424 RepID=A0A919QJH3_9ACTN|nr:DUF998 domain-containing protein [Acrocarpospora phusangensis]GIH27475.1 hypothetical protein Aph01nite_57850 [Acrocarpospora phusangensis]